MIVLIRGPLLSVTGYGSHARQVWKWARSKPGWDVYCNIVPWGQCTYYIDPAEEGGLIGDVMAKSSPPPRKPDLTLQIQLPDEWDPNLGVKNVGITAGIEADRCNIKWVDACRAMDRVIVPSEYSKIAFKNMGLEDSKIVNVPEAITCNFSDTPTASQMRKRLDGLSTDFNFLVFGQMTNPVPEADRKNTYNCLRWLCETFQDNREVGIVLKTNLGRLTVADRMHANSALQMIIDNVRKGPFPKIHLAHGLMDPSELGVLFTHEKIKALCAPTRGEGWGLPILDAASAGLPVIATKHSGHMDFMKHVKFLDLDYTLKEIPEEMADGRIWVKGARWAEPRADHFKSRVKKFHKGSSLPKQWAESAAPFINETYNMNSIMPLYDAALGGIIDCP